MNVIVAKMRKGLQLLKSWIKFLWAFTTLLPFVVATSFLKMTERFYSVIFPSEEQPLRNEVILFVGVVDSPLGFALALQLAKVHATVVLVGKSNEKCKLIVGRAKERGERMFFYDCDVHDQSSVTAAVELVTKDLGEITMMFQGSLLMENPSAKDLISSCVHFVNAVLPRMFENNVGQMVFLSLINDSIDYHYNHFVSGYYEWLLHHTREKRSLLHITQINVHKKISDDYSEENVEFGIFGTTEAGSLAKKIAKIVSQRKLSVNIPVYMFHVPKLLSLLPAKASDAIVDLMYRVY